MDILSKKVGLFIALVCYCLASIAILPHPACHTPCNKLDATQDKHTQCVQLANKTLYVRSAGQGQPTVIFSSGTGIPADNWFSTGIADKIASQAKVLAYDRLYTFNSCMNSNDFMPNTADTEIVRLHQLLALLKLSPPYILVGHSMGGLYMLHYARHYPQEVAGLVLLDATSDQGPTPLPKAAIPLLKALGNPQNPNPEDGLYNELIGQLPSYIQAQQAPPLPKNMPIIVLASSQHCLPLAWTKRSMCMTPTQETTHQRQQQQIAALSTQADYQLLQGGHNVFFTSAGSKIVIEAINKLLIKQRKN